MDYFAAPPASGIGEIVLVASDRPSCGALERARASGVTARSCAPRSIGVLLQEHDVDLVALAGYLRLLPGDVTDRFLGRIVNVHPALLPAFGGRGMYGRRVHEAVLASGARTSGATVHFVNDAYDAGAVIARREVPVLEGDTPDTLAARVLAAEHALYPPTIAAVARGDIALDEVGSVRCTTTPGDPGPGGASAL